MNDLLALSKAIKEKRLSMNLRMDDVAKKADITRATLYSIENGGGCSTASLFKVLNVLGIDLLISNAQSKENKRSRATRTNTALDKKINRFIIFCVEQYAHATKKSSASVYKKMNEKGVIEDLTNDYEDLHGMSTMYLNDYIAALLEENK